MRRVDLGVLLVGAADSLIAELERHPDAGSLDVSVVPAPDAVAMDEPPAAVLRRKPAAAVRVASDLVAGGEAVGLFSAGNTGATVLAAHKTLGRLPGVERPALATTVPSADGRAVLLDAGANVECRPSHLLQFGAMGVAYAKAVLGVAEPRVGLLSIGEEAIKGNDLTREAHRLLEASGLRFIGNLEARDLFGGHADVIVCDGFTGNVALKVGEGLVEVVQSYLREELDRSTTTRIGALLSRPAHERFRRRVDYSEVGGAPLLGVAGLCVVGHGRSSVKAVRNAVSLAHRLADEDVLGQIRTELVSAASPDGCESGKGRQA